MVERGKIFLPFGPVSWRRTAATAAATQVALITVFNSLASLWGVPTSRRLCLENANGGPALFFSPLDVEKNPSRKRAGSDSRPANSFSSSLRVCFQIFFALSLSRARFVIEKEEEKLLAALPSCRSAGRGDYSVVSLMYRRRRETIIKGDESEIGVKKKRK